MKIISLLSIVLLFFSCKKDGCQDPTALNYNPDSNGKGSCLYEPEPTQVVDSFAITVTVIDSPTLGFNSGYADVHIGTDTIFASVMNPTSIALDYCAQTLYSPVSKFTENTTHYFEVYTDNKDIHGNFTIASGELSYNITSETGTDEVEC